MLNEDKCETLTIKGKMRKGMDEPTLYILGKQVKQVESMRYLGLFLDPYSKVPQTKKPTYEQDRMVN